MALQGGSTVPPGLDEGLTESYPSDKSLGYSQMSLWERPRRGREPITEPTRSGHILSAQSLHHTLERWELCCCSDHAIRFL